MDLEALKKKVDRFGRKAVAREVQIAYPTLSQKLNGYIKLSQVEEYAIQAALRSAEKTEHKGEEGPIET